MLASLVAMKTVTPQSKANAIIEDELRLLARVSSVLSEISTGIPGAPDFDSALINLRDQIGEAKPEDMAALVEQMMRISAIARRYGKGRALPVDPESPYFAHLRLEEGDSTRDVLIGKRGFIDRGRKVQIVDWRNAPVSRIYYRYEEGDDYEEEFGERTMEGWVKARRSITIDDGRLQRIGCPQGTFIIRDDNSWVEASPVATSQLSGGQGTAARPPRKAMQRGRSDARLGVHSGPVLRADKHLPQIAALIDRDQFDLITRPSSGLVVLQGGAGSGKTTVALHRVAYLNFAMPGRFKGRKVMVVVPTEAMARYVKHVLPSLGVKGVPVLTVRRWFETTRRRVVPAAPDSYSEQTPQEVARLKKHPMVLQLLAEFCQRQVTRGSAALEQLLAKLDGGAALLEHWRSLAQLPPVSRCARFRAWLKTPRGPSVAAQHRASSEVLQLSRRLRDVVADWGEIFTDRQLLGEAAGRLCPGEFTDRDLDRVSQWCTRQLDDALPRTADSDEAKTRGPFAATAKKVDPFISVDGQDERPSGKVGFLDPQDDALLLHLAQLKRGELKPPGGKAVRYQHLVVDEAQDLSVVELKVLIDATTKIRSVTLAGDTAQRMVFDNAFSTWEALLKRIDAPPATTRTLRLGYRSTQPIMDLAQQLVGENIPHHELHSTRTGALVELHRFQEQGEAVAMLAEALRSLALREPRSSVALIARHPEQARAYSRSLSRSEVPGLRLVSHGEFGFQAGIEVTDVSQVKGLEFDYVVLLDVTPANYPETLESRHLLHIAATRAAHQLWLVSLGSPSPVLPAEL